MSDVSDVYFKASLQNTLNPEVGTLDNVGNKSGVFTLEDGEYYLTNNTSNAYRVYYPTEDIYSVGFTIEFDINYSFSSGFEWCLLFNGDDSSYWHGFGTSGSDLEYRGQGLSAYRITTSPNTWLHVKCVFDYYLEQNFVRIYIDNLEVNSFNISKNYGIKYIDILGNSSGYVADAKIKNIIIYNSSKKHFLDTIGLTTIWAKIKSLFATKTELSNGLNSKANDDDVVHKSGDETIEGNKTFNSDIKIVKNSPFYYSLASDYVKGEAPSSNVYQGIRFFDNPNSSSGNHITGGFEIMYDTTGYTIASINARTYVNGSQVWRSINLRVPNDSTRSIDFFPVSNSEINLGTPSNKWKNVYANAFNGINPGALSLPSNNAVNILSALQSGGYTAPSNGYVRAIKNVETECTSTLGIRNETTGIEDRRIAERVFVLGVIVPVQAGEKVIISDDWNSVSNATITYSAHFYPCKGNV